MNAPARKKHRTRYLVNRKNDELKGLCLRVNRVIELLNEKGAVAKVDPKR